MTKNGLNFIENKFEKSFNIDENHLKNAISGKFASTAILIARAKRRLTLTR